MAASGQIQVIPPGLLGFFQIKNNGRNPGSLDDVIQGNLELREWLFLAREEDLLSAGNPSQLSPAGAGLEFFGTNNLQVPANQAWWVREYTVRAVLGAVATDGIRFQAAYAPVTGNQACWPGSDTTFVQGAVGNAPHVISVAKDFMVQPGTRFGYYKWQCITATTIAMDAFCRFVRLPL